MRELENRIKRAVVMADGILVSADDLGLSIPEEGLPSLAIRAARARAEREVLQLALAQAGTNLSKVANCSASADPRSTTYCSSTKFVSMHNDIGEREKRPWGETIR